MATLLSDDVLRWLLNESVLAALRASERIMKIYVTGQYTVNLKSNSTPLTQADRESHKAILEHLYPTRIPVLSEEGRLIHFDERRAWDLFWLVDPLDGTKEFINHNGEFTVNIALIENAKPVIGVIYVPVEKRLYFAVRGHGSYRLSDVAVDRPRSECTLEALLEKAQKLPIQKEPFPFLKGIRPFTVVESRSHLSGEMESYIEDLRKGYRDLKVIPKGSSLKMCMLAEGEADLYPRITPNYEWDTAAGQALVEMAKGEVVDMERFEPLYYNKENMLNPPFVVKHIQLQEVPKR